MEDLEKIKSITKDFREQKDALWIGIGKLLVKRGIDITKVIVADCFPEDHSQYYVVLVTPNRGVFEFYYDWLHKDAMDGEIIEWNDFTDAPQKAYMHESVEIALKHLGQI